MKPIIKMRIITGSFLLLAAIILWIWIIWPIEYIDKVIDFPVIAYPDSRFTSVVNQVNDQSFQIYLKYPVRMHSGDTGKITIQISSTAETTDTATQSSDGQVMAEGRIDLPLFILDPQGNIQQSFSTLSPPQFTWQIKTTESGIFEGQFWFYFLFVSPDGRIDRQALLSIPLQVEEKDLLGFPENRIIWIAGIFTVLGLLILPILTLLPKNASENHD